MKVMGVGEFLLHLFWFLGNGRGREGNKFVCFVALTTPMSLWLFRTKESWMIWEVDGGVRKKV